MSKSIQDYISFATKFPFEGGITRQNARLSLTGGLSRLFVFCFLFVFPAVLYAQPPAYEVDPTFNPLSDNLLNSKSVWSNGNVSIRNFGGVSGTVPARLGNWWISGNLENEGTAGIRYLTHLTVERDLTNRSEIHDVTNINVEGDLLNAAGGIISDGANKTLMMPGTIMVGGDLTNDGTISNFSSIFAAGLLSNNGEISDVNSIVVRSNSAKDSPGSGIIVIGDEPALSYDTAGSFYNKGLLANVMSVTVSDDVLLGIGSSLENIGTISAGRNLVVDGVVDGGFRVLDASGKLDINGHLTIDKGSVANAHVVNITGGKPHGELYDFVNNGFLQVGTTITSTGSVFNDGTISSVKDFINYGTIFGNGLVSFDREVVWKNGRQTEVSGRFENTPSGTVIGKLTVNGDFLNAGGKLHLTTQWPSGKEVVDVIRITNGTATILGGTVDTSEFFGEAGKQYLFLATDSPGKLDVLTPLTVTGNYQPGSVINFAPVYGYWDGTKYVAGRRWEQNNQNQYYWLEMQRAYKYGQYADTPNQIAIGNYLDTVGSAPKQNSAFWNMLVRLDAISDDPTNPYNKNGIEEFPHHGAFNPAALRALDEMSGQIYANLGAATVHNTGVINRTLADVLRSDVFRFSMMGNPNNAVRGQVIAPLRYTRWGTVFGIGGSSKHDGNTDGYESSFGGAMAGIDRAMWTGTRLGAYISAAAGQVSMRSLDESSDITSVSVGMYLRQEMYYGYGFASAGFGTDWYKTERHLNMIGYRAEGKTHASIGTVYLERGIDIPVYYATVQPYTSFQIVSAHQNKFTEMMWDETGRYTDVGLEGVEGITNSFKMAIGLRAASQPIQMRWGQLAITKNIAWFHDFQGKNDRDYIARFSNRGNGNFGGQFSDITYKIDGNDPKQDWFNLGLGLNMDRNSTRLYLGGDLFTNSRQTLCSGNLGFTTSW